MERRKGGAPGLVTGFESAPLSDAPTVLPLFAGNMACPLTRFRRSAFNQTGSSTISGANG